MLRLNTKETSMNVVAAFATVLAASIGFIDSAKTSAYDNSLG
jgi:hypothetical protein